MWPVAVEKSDSRLLRKELTLANNDWQGSGSGSRIAKSELSCPKFSRSGFASIAKKLPKVGKCRPNSVLNRILK